EAKMGKVMRHTLGASLNIRHNLSSSKGPKPLQLKLLTTYIPKTSAFTLAFSTSQRLRTTRASARTFFRSEERFSRNAETDLVCRLLLEKKNNTHQPQLTTYPMHHVLPPPSHLLISHRSHHTYPAPVSPLSLFIAPPTTDLSPLSLHDALPI